ncbi:MAG: non-homologous end-joining DNA ligase [Chromatiales bacterium]|jgi:bifunctional non-homologous end joining protein LigD|nr:non-homologous end-joining DNA ligase [Chromatiales bacterium]
MARAKNSQAGSGQSKQRDLKTYQSRRDFSRTPEPSSSAHATNSGSFVIQKHAARRTHFDLRLELSGVLKSWAVTRGPSLDPAQKRLAVRTEDHPIAYGDFEGTIPAGEYGGGTVMLWDRGYWQAHSGAHQGLRKGNLKFTLHGRRLRGGFALVRMKRDEKARRRAAENWLLIKEKDQWVDRDLDPVERWERSILTRRTMTTIARATKKTGSATHLPDFMPPQLAAPVDTPPQGAHWLHEIKYDGYRVLILIASGQVRIDTRSGLDWTEKFPGIARACAELKAVDAIIDGEAVILDTQGISRFSLLQQAIKHHRAEILLMAFDLLQLDGEDLRPLPLLERKQRLKTLLKNAPEELRYCDHQSGSGKAMLSAACAMGLEGIISKRDDLPYTAGRSPAWSKIHCICRAEFVIGGYRPSSARDRPFASLLLGEYVDEELRYRGRVGTGFDSETLAELGERMHRLSRRTNPFASVPAAIARQAQWLSPQLVAEIVYIERTPDGALRHPRFLGLRRDKAARDVIGSRAAP